MKNKNTIKLVASFFGLSLLMGLIAVPFRKDTSKVEAAKYSQTVNEYYSNINWDLTGANLKTALFNKIKISSAGWSYDGLWEAYKTTDVRPDGTHFWDIYSDTTDYTLNDKRINASYKKEGDSINREHVIPQSSFNEAAPMKSDIHHVLPSDGYVNNRRSSYPHGIVTGSVTYTSNDGCKLGNGTGNTTVFEPMDNYKGDIARIYFYFVTCYQDKMSNNSFSAFDKSTYPSIKTAYLNVYLQWAKEDPVSEKEIIRNNGAYAGQGNRNPFIDCPYAVGAIWDSAHASDYGNKGEYTSGEGLTISKTSVNMISGGTTSISATSTGSGNITWTSSNSSVVSVSPSSTSSGSSVTLTAGNAGSATITATTTISGKQHSKSCTVTVAATKQVTSIAVSNQKTSYAVDETFVKPTVIATYNDGTEADVSSEATFSGYDMSVADVYTVTVSYSYGGVAANTSYEITVSSSGGSTDIDDYTISTTPLTSSGIKNNMKVVWGTSTTNLASSVGSNWVYLSSTPSSWIIFTVEGTSSGFKLKCNDGYIYCSGAKKVDISTSSTTFTLRSDNLVTNNDAGTFYYNSTGLRPYTSGSYTDAYLYELTQNKTLSEIDVTTFPTKMNYSFGEAFDPTGMAITRTYSDNSHDTYAYDGHEYDFTFDPSPVTPLQAGDETIEVIYGGQSCFFEIELTAPKVLSSIGVSGQTSNFVEGDAFSFGGTVTAYYEDGSSENVTSSSTFSGYDMTTVGNQTVTVSYIDKSTTYSINVIAGTLSSITVSGQTTTYQKGAGFVFDGVCTATFANGYEKEVTPTSVSSPDMSTGGVKTVTVTFTYNGKTVNATYDITVNTQRKVYEYVEGVLGTVTYPNNIETISDESLSVSTTGYTAKESDAIRLGSGSSTGSVIVHSTSSNITKVVVSAKTYGTDSGVHLEIDGDDNTITSSYRDYEKEYLSPTDVVEIATTANKKRAYVQSITIYALIETDISSSPDCIGLETFITNYMHMDYVENLGYCKDTEHHYYSSAKSAFNTLNDHQRSLFTGNSAYTAEWNRLSTWATFNGDSLNENTNQLEMNPGLSSNIYENNNTSLIVIISLSVVSMISIGVLIYLKKKKHQ